VRSAPPCTDLEKPVGRVLPVLDVISQNDDRQSVADEAEQTQQRDEHDVDRQLERLESVDGGRGAPVGGRRTRHERVEPGEVVRGVGVVVEDRSERRVHAANTHGGQFPRLHARRPVCSHHLSADKRTRLLRYR